MADNTLDDTAPDEPPALDINIETVCYIIVKAREFDAKTQEDVSEDASDEADDDEIKVLAETADDPTILELSEAIDDLNEDDQITLIALTWLGRGDFDLSEWDQVLALADERHRADSAGYLTGMPLLGDYLEEGLAAFGLSCDAVARSHL